MELNNDGPLQCVFQVINMPDGTRSPHGLMTRPMMAKFLKSNLADKLDQYAVLILLDDVTGQMEISKAPLMHARTFVQNFGEQDNG